MRLTISYKGTIQKFILEWLELMCKYEDFTPLGVSYQPIHKKAMLQNLIKTYLWYSTSRAFGCWKRQRCYFYDGFTNAVQRSAANQDNCHPFIKENVVQWFNSTKLLLDFDDKEFHDPDHYNDDLDDTVVNFDSFSIHEARQEKYPRLSTEALHGTSYQTE